MSLSKLEQLKAQREPLEVIKDIYKEANDGIPLSTDYIGLLKWYGMYPHINHKDIEDKKYFMKRIKLVDASLNLEQLKVMANIAKDYAQGLVDFTTRENIQFHYIQIKDLPEIFTLLDSVGLTSRMASGDGPRPIVTCGASGLDKEEVLDVISLVKKIDTFFDTNSKEYSNFPRKYKVGISGCKCCCIPHEIQDIALRAFKKDDEILFDLTLGGGLSKSKQIAYRANRYVTQEQAQDVIVACAEIFRDNGNRDSRTKARVRHLINDWGLEKFVDELEKKLGYSLKEGKEEPFVDSFENRNHFGIQKSKIDGESFIGFATNSGRLEQDDLNLMYEILKKYKAKGIRLTTTQNFIVFGVKDEDALALAKEFDSIGYSYAPTYFKARTQSCTGKEFCKFAITETKVFSKELVLSLEKEFPDFNENFMIAISGCGNACSHPQIADIGLIACKVKNEESKRVEGYEIFYGGNLQGERNSSFAKSSGLKIESEKIFDFICSLINEYRNSNSKLSFKEYITTLEVKKEKE